jgi:hypothetical protein
MPRAQKTGSWGHCRSGDFPDREEKQAQEASVAGHQWLTPVILATQEAEIKRIAIWSQPRQIICDTLSRKNSIQKRAGGVAKGVRPEFKPQYCKKKKKASVLGEMELGLLPANSLQLPNIPPSLAVLRVTTGVKQLRVPCAHNCSGFYCPFC